jgi:tyrosyl-tRNA synthetase
MGFFSRTPSVSTDEYAIDEILSRSIAEVLPTKDTFKKTLMSGKRLRFYIGTDATGPQLHLGHATNYHLLEKFRRLGHEIIILFGDYTALIGDPTDKDATRKALTVAQVNENIRDWKSQVEKIVNFKDRENPAKIMRNSEWLSKLNYEKMIELASAFTVQHMIERDMFEKRLEAGKPIYLHEFLYPLAQGYDSVAMNVDVEVGGTDQTFNMLAGRILQRKYNNRDKFVISTTLLENPVTGKKLMSKSEGSYIALNDNPTDMYGKTMALPDAVVKQMFVDTTLLPLSEVDKILTLHPKEAKMRLAKELVTLYHSKKAAEKAETDFVSTFSKGEVPADILEVSVGEGVMLVDVINAELGESKTNLRRLILQGAISEIGGETVTNPLASVTRSATYRIGKHRFLKIVVK